MPRKPEEREAPTADADEMTRRLLDLAALANEPLHPDLVPWVIPDGPFGPMLKHPLIFDITVSMTPGVANQQYEAKRKALTSAQETGDWQSVVWLHERPYRLGALHDVIDQVPRDLAKSLLTSIWTDSENIWENLEDWRDLLTEYGMTMNAEEQRAFGLLPVDEEDRITVYRGGVRYCSGEDINLEGLSWSIDRARAEWFATRFEGHLEDERESEIERVVVVGRVKRAKVLGHLLRRNEEEIVALPEDVEVLYLAPGRSPRNAVRFDVDGGHWWVRCDHGHVHYGEAGAAGLLLRTRQDGQTPTNRYLLARRSPGTDSAGTWGYPGGAIKTSSGAPESPRAAALREAVEEGLPAMVAEGLPEPTDTRVDDHGRWSYTTILIDVPDEIGAFDVPPNADEHDDVAWVTLDEALDLNLHDGVEATLRWAAAIPVPGK